MHSGPMQTRNLAEERYISLTTFKKDGTPKPMPVWAVDAGEGRLGFVTSSKTWKVKRIINNATVEVQPSDSRGKVKEGSEPIQGTAQIVEGQEFDRLYQLVKAKYGYQLKIINFMHALPGKRTGHANDRAVS